MQYSHNLIWVTYGMQLLLVKLRSYSQLAIGQHCLAQQTMYYAKHFQKLLLQFKPWSNDLALCLLILSTLYFNISNVIAHFYANRNVQIKCPYIALKCVYNVRRFLHMIQWSRRFTFTLSFTILYSGKVWHIWRIIHDLPN